MKSASTTIAIYRQNRTRPSERGEACRFNEDHARGACAATARGDVPRGRGRRERKQAGTSVNKSTRLTNATIDGALNALSKVSAHFEKRLVTAIITDTSSTQFITFAKKLRDEQNMEEKVQEFRNG